ncbi:hypothetical protein [Pelagibacterium halotolerans]|uniref:hypothetical protein n=1 Tax=Pelagibacterium halotolerans TaxID=531813 RepID=UPI00384E87BD
MFRLSLFGLSTLVLCIFQLCRPKSTNRFCRLIKTWARHSGVSDDMGFIAVLDIDSSFGGLSASLGDSGVTVEASV